jgi:EAL domain-containing protein (putative c-di-GMP-specific phosphodiesterase class I)
VEQAILYQQDQYHQHGVKVAIAINLSVRLLNDTGFRKKILERLIAYDFFAGSLILEITEDILVPTPMTPICADSGVIGSCLQDSGHCRRCKN